MQGGRVKNNSLYFIVYEIEKENDGLASNHAVADSNVSSDKKLARIVKRKLYC